jgi:hypothetical protein
MDEPGRPEQWLHSDPNSYAYSPKNIRKALDKRDRNKNPNLPKKSGREQQYGMLSRLGAHPGRHGLELQRDGIRVLNMGPFKQKETLRQCIEEMARSCVLLAGKLIQYCYEFDENGTQIASALAIRFQRIHEVYF